MKNILVPTLAIILAIAVPAFARAEEPAVVHDAHEAMLFNRIQLEVDYADRNGGLWNGHLDGWIGGDVDRLWIRAAGEIADGEVEKAELQLFYGRNVHPFWDLLVGVRQDVEPDDETWLAAGVVGLAPYFFETEATAWLSTEGDVAARFEQSLDIPVTQKLIAEPHLELNLYAQDMPKRGIGAGFSSIEAGLQLRYEITRKFAPYLDLVWERKLGETASLARAAGDSVDDTTLRIGLRTWF